MGQKATKQNKKNIEEEFQYISEQTGLDVDELKTIYETYSKKNKMNKKEFIQTYRIFYPK